MTTPTKPTEVAVPTTADGVRDLLARAAKGDKTTLPAVRMLLQDPANIDLMGGDMGGDLARYAQDLFVKALSGDGLAVREAVHAKMAVLRKELLGENPTPVEVFLAERVVACRLQVQDADIRAAGADNPTLKQADFHQRRMDATHRRYLSALKALALVRKLAVPALQVNIARKQVNVVAPPTATG